jgi:hypothetical protein
LLSKENVKFLAAKQIDNIGDWKNYSAEWEINSAGVRREMLPTYQKNKQEILQSFYKNIGNYYHDDLKLNEINL